MGERSLDFVDLAPSQALKSGEGNEALSYHPRRYNPIEISTWKYKASVQLENIFSGNSTLKIYRVRSIIGPRSLETELSLSPPSSSFSSSLVSCWRSARPAMPPRLALPLPPRLALASWKLLGSRLTSVGMQKTPEGFHQTEQNLLIMAALATLGVLTWVKDGLKETLGSMPLLDRFKTDLKLSSPKPRMAASISSASSFSFKGHWRHVARHLLQHLQASIICYQSSAVIPTDTCCTGTNRPHCRPHCIQCPPPHSRKPLGSEYYNLYCCGEEEKIMNGYNLTIGILECKYVNHPLFEASRAVWFQIGLHLWWSLLAFLAKKNAYRLISTPPCSAHLKAQCQSP